MLAHVVLYGYWQSAWMTSFHKHMETIQIIFSVNLIYKFPAFHCNRIFISHFSCQNLSKHVEDNIFEFNTQLRRSIPDQPWRKKYLNMTH